MKMGLYEDLSAVSTWGFRDKRRDPAPKAALHPEAMHRGIDQKRCCFLGRISARKRHQKALIFLMS
jgi:hypothetical protein